MRQHLQQLALPITRNINFSAKAKTKQDKLAALNTRLIVTGDLDLINLDRFKYSYLLTYLLTNLLTDLLNTGYLVRYFLS